jgi:transposase
MKRKRKQYSGAFKAKIGLEALIGMKTTAQIARENQVHPLLVGQWKGVLRERMPELFERGQQAPEDSEKLIAQLHQKIGQQAVDLDWLKKKCKQLGLSLRDEN